MKNFIKSQEEIIKTVIKECGYDIDSVDLLVSSRSDLGQYQFNGIMNLAKKYKKIQDLQKKLFRSKRI